jgi:serine/threonine protein phosphatase PrpC
VANHLKRNALTEKELATCAEIKLAIDDIQIKPENYPFIYGTTLLAALVAPDFWFAVQIGDGKTVVLDEKGKPAVPEALIIDENNDAESQAFGRTYSLCDSHAAEHFHRTFGFNKIKGLVVASDGVSDSFLPDKYLDYLSDLRNNFIEQPAAAQKGLSDFLPTLSEEGSRDDVSIAGVVR